jgi:hypothetical protein
MAAGGRKNSRKFWRGTAFVPDTMQNPRWLLNEPSKGLRLFAEGDGLWLRPISGSLAAPQLQSFQPRCRLGRLLPALIPQLVEMGLASCRDGGFSLEYSDFINLREAHSIDAFDGLVPWSGWVTQLETTGTPGTAAFGYIFRFYAGQQPVYPERLGCFVRRGDEVRQLDPQTYALIEAVDSFNALPAERRAGSEAFIHFADIKGLAEEVGAELDRFLLHEKIVIPSEIALDIVPEAGGHISFAPKIDGVETEAFRRAFFAFDDPEEVYSVDGAAGSRVRVVLNAAQQEVLRRMQKVRHVGGADKAEVLRDPSRVFDGLGETVKYGPRVYGVGDFPFVARPYLQRSATGIFDDPESCADRPDHGRFSAGLKCEYLDGSVETVEFSSRDQLRRFVENVTAAHENGGAAVEFKGKSIPVNDRLLKEVRNMMARLTVRPGRARSEPSAQPRQFLLIYTNDGELEYEEATGREASLGPLVVPASLRREVVKNHQLQGLRWLEANYRQGRHGCLLADDMGLGKTLQLLAFMAWLIEQGGLVPEGNANGEAAPWNPILVAMPLTLLENETWTGDVKKFFASEGSVFQPWASLHGSKLREFRWRQGTETTLGGPVLDLNRLRQYRLVLTNYETVVNYQHSFAKVDWSLVVTDEAQEYKTSDTKVSHALKSLAPKFRIACTGTPVETRLLDVWNIFDFLQPGHLGSAKAFSHEYEQPLLEAGSNGPERVLTHLKERLRFGKQDALVLRREKGAVLDLPQKHEQQIACELSERQREWHLDLVDQARSGGPGRHPFSLISQLMKVYQHPALLPRYEALPPSDLVAQCPKLQAVLRCLENIQRREEKALIFTRSLDMQQVLQSVIADRFRISVDIINGATSRSGDTNHSKGARRDILSRFREAAGFGAIILSPDVAGIGLTLVEANHVIHYGRWWNPAKESQATDRAYRIGQTRDVYVYYPVARDPHGEFQTFDEKLDALITRRRRLAADFLAPVPGEDKLQHELLEDVLNDTKGTGEGRPITAEYVQTLPWRQFEALIALLERKRGASVLLTPCAADDKADVIAARKPDLWLIQCKHTSYGTTLDADPLAEICNALDTYRHRYLRALTGKYALHGAVVTNGKFTNRARALAHERDIKIVSAAELGDMLEQTPCTPGEVEAVESDRLASMRDVQAAILRLS